MLAEGGGNDVFSALLAKARDDADAVPGSSDWRFFPTEEDNSVLARKDDEIIVIIAGRQLISAEKLELLSLFSSHVFPDNRYPLKELASLVTDRGGLPRIAWGVGKWMGRRGRVVQEFLDHPPVHEFLVGDNGNRPSFWPYPKLLARAEEQGISSLAGSDPLPLPNHAARAGSYGAALADAMLGETAPAAELRAILVAGASLRPYGRGVDVMQFFRDQLQVTLNKRLGKSGR
jgi:hypothetical protein